MLYRTNLKCYIVQIWSVISYKFEVLYRTNLKCYIVQIWSVISYKFEVLYHTKLRTLILMKYIFSHFMNSHARSCWYYWKPNLNNNQNMLTFDFHIKYLKRHPVRIYHMEVCRLYLKVSWTDRQTAWQTDVYGKSNLTCLQITVLFILA